MRERNGKKKLNSELLLCKVNEDVPRKHHANSLDSGLDTAVDTRALSGRFRLDLVRV